MLNTESENFLLRKEKKKETCFVSDAHPPLSPLSLSSVYFRKILASIYAKRKSLGLGPVSSLSTQIITSWNN